MISDQQIEALRSGKIRTLRVIAARSCRAGQTGRVTDVYRNAVGLNFGEQPDHSGELFYYEELEVNSL